MQLNRSAMGPLGGANIIGGKPHPVQMRIVLFKATQGQL